MEYISVTADNIDREHICCAISKADDCQTASKKAWLKDRFSDGLVFLKGEVRGKFFIEYLPAEKAWAPIDAAGYMYIDCLWIAGQFKGHGYGNELMDACIRDSREKGMRGVCALSSQNKKLPFLSDPKFLMHRGFLTADTAEPYFALMVLPFSPDAPAVRFGECVKQPAPAADGFVIYYTDQCPYTAKYVPLLAAAAETHGIALRTEHITSFEQAQHAPMPYTSFALYRDGRFVTHEIPSEQKFLKLAGVD